MSKPSKRKDFDMKPKITLVMLHKHHYSQDKKRPGYGNCSRCGRYAELNGGGKNGRKPQFCDACIRGLADGKGVYHG